ncbi:uncharacterized protein N7482_008961 [Penicillium canariense]|uniref:UBC core domain-containing protein n=1 Tax=Penicillium canariense TaxID=189055 RepID=A0A9W9HUR0_9EURO|nr:uncharacterized protein N7482_008961 [Penicillium canariense]KAJ5157861.1 hypothetical protein N7482_008961 [Penicillium canariense]
MADQCALRVMRELRQLDKSDQLAMTVIYKESNIREITALLIGPPGTPYALGFYQFSISVPPDYPAKPPNVLIRTTNRGRTRFGPNLYGGGKVCLTWESEPGEQWSPAQGLESVLLSIQSLLSSKPYHLEPGFETDDNEEQIELYNAKNSLLTRSEKEIAKSEFQIRHENLRLTVITPLEKAFGIEPPPVPYAQLSGTARCVQQGWGPVNSSIREEPELHNPFLDFYKKRFLWYLEMYKHAIQEGLEKEKNRHRHDFPMLPFEHPGNSMRGTWDYEDLKARLEKLEDCTMDETHNWPIEGLELVKKDVGIAVSLRAQHEQIASGLGRRGEAMVDLELVDDNPFLWRLTYFGRPMTQYDGGVLKIKIFVSPRHPIEQPRVFLETPLYHVRVSKKNVLVYLPTQADEMSRHIEGIINSLEEETPPFNPLLIVNPEASKLCWGNKEEQRQYSRKLRRSVAATLE